MATITAETFMARFNLSDETWDALPASVADAMVRALEERADMLAALEQLERVESSPHSETVRYLAREDARAAIARARGEG